MLTENPSFSQSREVEGAFCAVLDYGGHIRTMFEMEDWKPCGSVGFCFVAKYPQTW